MEREDKRGAGGPAARFGESLTGSLPQSPAAERNREPILEVLTRVLPRSGDIVEIASGTGQHAVYFARALPRLSWQPTEADPELLDVIRRRAARRPLGNLLPPLRLDVLSDEPWPVQGAGAVVCINMIHIAPQAATGGLFGGAARLLPPGAPLVLYGPFLRRGVPTAPSNRAFDSSLKARDADWGLRELELVAEVAGKRGFTLDEIVEMPANNLIVVFSRDPASAG